MDRVRIDVSTDSARYPVLIEPGLVGSLSSLLDGEGFPRRRILVSSPAVWRLHGPAIAHGALDPDPVLVPDGERAKTVTTVNRIYDALIRRAADRAAGLVAIGGGVIGDMAGFAAATYLRGIAVAHVPTTLLAQVDSAVGGKVGVNHALGKNLIGAFHQPRLVAVDPTVLATLPRREFRAGLYEVVKYGMAFDAALFAVVRAHVSPIFARDVLVLSPIIADCCRIKARVVGEDERERGPRRLLNFGHTAGHAFEAVTRFRRYRHGEAIAWGMLVAAELSLKRGTLDTAGREALGGLITALGPLPPVGDLSTQEVLAAIRRDKKVVDGRLHFVISTGVGSSAVVNDVEEEEVRAALLAVGVSR